MCWAHSDTLLTKIIVNIYIFNIHVGGKQIYCIDFNVFILKSLYFLKVIDKSHNRN